MLGFEDLTATRILHTPNMINPMFLKTGFSAWLSKRPTRPMNKRLSLEMTQVGDELQEGPQQLFAGLASQVAHRRSKRPLICLKEKSKM